MLKFSAVDTLGIYIQVPFCQTKCTYCNFHTGVVSAGRFAPYVDAVCAEIRGRKELWASSGINLARVLEDSAVDTVYIGGGTPSLLEPELLGTMLQAVRANFRCEFGEVTLEADPETVTLDKANAWREMGIGRISFGTQSFVDEELRAAGRMHRREDIYRAADILRGANIRNISFDLIAGLPKQTVESWNVSLDETIQLSPEHVSVYMMEIDEGSRLGLEVLQKGSRYSARDLPTEEEMASFYEAGQDRLKAAGYLQYEISNWAKPGFASQHNLKYWRRERYLGFGAGAHSYSGAQRWANKHDAAAYASTIATGQSAVQSVDAVTRESALEEEFFLGLRQLAGIDVARIESEYKIDLREKVRRLSSAGMLQQEGNNVRLAADKLGISNEVIVELLR
jgi:oxygen-independent coproporphyrinogen-3 oxidase